MIYYAILYNTHLPAGGINNDGVEAVLARVGDGLPRDVHGRGVRPLGEDAAGMIFHHIICILDRIISYYVIVSNYITLDDGLPRNANGQGVDSPGEDAAGI
jgi:hypothetical protein